MKTIQPANPLTRQAFLKWYHVASLGQALQARESRYLRSTLKLTYSRKTLQVGRLGSESHYIDQDFIGDFVLADSRGPRSHPNFVQADANDLPFATETIDTVILPHVLEFESDRHQVLREVERVLKPEGRLFILGLSPWSPRRLFRLGRRDSFWNSRLIASHHLLEWLSLLKFDADLEAAFGVSGDRILKNPETTWAEIASNLSLGYAIKAIKRQYNLIPIESSWISLPTLATGQVMESTATSTRTNND
ncbi:MAG: class I SAM-dependent methyltransferase [Methylococcaceae bacterium]|jgi:SAM-dependent methyltransferase